MANYSMAEAQPRPYLYVERRTSMAPEAISAAMGSALGEIMAFLRSHGIEPTGPPLAVYRVYRPDSLDFEAGIFVSEPDMVKASGDVHAGRTPSGRVVTLTHVGPYRDLRKTYAALMKYLEREELTFGSPTWEVYVDDPDTTPEESLRTEIFVSVA